MAAAFLIGPPELNEKPRQLNREEFAGPAGPEARAALREKAAKTED